MKQSVYPNGTKCFTRQNSLFRRVKLKGFTLKFVFSSLFLISLDTFFLYKRNQ